MNIQPSFCVGIEEEYMLVDLVTRDLVGKAPRSLMPAMKKKLGGCVSPEFLQSQVEIGTPVCHSIAEAKEELGQLRKGVAEVAADHDMAIIAASTHPFARPESQSITRKQRYEQLANDLQAVVRRFLISGMHVHVAVENDDLRIDLMNQASYILPHLLALSTSSPFWTGENTGLMSYRMSVWNEMPRTGLPHNFESYSEYQRHVDVLVKAQVIQDSTKIWWDLRPSDHYPTLEMRIADLTTSIDDTLCIAAIYMCWLRMLYRLRKKNQKWRRYSNMLLNENRWRAHRYGTDQGLIDFGLGEIVSYSDLLNEILALIEQDAQEAGCSAEVFHARTILDRGTSAHRQIQIYQNSIQSGQSDQQSLVNVVDWLRKETLNF